MLHQFLPDNDARLLDEAALLVDWYLPATRGAEAAAGTSGDIGVGVTWEADVWGKVRAGARAAEENLRATTLDFQYARQSLAARVAKTWFLATELHQQVALVDEVVKILAVLAHVGRVARVLADERAEHDEVDAVGANPPNRLGDVVRIQPARQEDGDA